MARKIYMNVAEGDECRIAVMEDGRLYEFFIDRPSQLKHVGNIYKGIINNIEPGIQAAFVDIGLERNGFLHVSDVSYSYQGNNDVKQLFSKTLRIKEPLSEEELLHERKERDVEEVDEFVGDGTSSAEAKNGTSEAEFLDKLDEEHPGHQVTDSPLEVAPVEKEAAPAAEAKPTEAPRPEAPNPEAAPASAGAGAPADGVKKKRRRRGRRGKKHGAAASGAFPAVQPDNTTAPAGKPEDKSPANETAETPQAPASVAQPTEAKSDAPPKAEAKPATEPAKSDAPKKKRRRTPKRRGGHLPKRVTDEIENPNAGTTKAPEAPKPAPEKPIDGPSGGDNGTPGPLYRYHRPPLPKLQNLLKRGQEVVCQVTKASQGGKGPGLSTFVSLPGRYMVLTPNSDRGGVSRKIEDGGARNELRKMLDKLPVPEGMGVIVRTAAINRTFEDLHRDLNYLLRVWSVISERIHDSEAPALLYTDSDPAIRAVRDYFTADTTEIVIDDKVVFDRVLAFFDQLMPSFRERVKLYESDVPLFFSVGLENQLDHIFDKKVNLKSGGYLFVEQTEALISIDVNSGKFTSAGDAEKTAFQTNMEAIPEICRQLRLRDLGGIVCCDLIDMASAKHRSDVEHALRRELRKDRARTKVAKMSPFGVIEMTRQRVRPSIKNYTYVSCPTCAGFGMVRSAETMCLSLLRRMKLALLEERVVELAVQIHPHVLSHLHSEFRDDINELEDKYGKRIVFEYAKDLILGQARFFYINDRAARVLYDMDQRINTFAQGGPKASTNVPLPPATSGAASPAAGQAAKDAKGRRRRRGGRRQREREQERTQREQRIKEDSSKAVTFGDTLPEARVEVVREEPKRADAGKPGEGKRRRGRRGGRKAREREAAKGGRTEPAGAPAKSDPPAAASDSAPSTRKSSGRKAAAAKSGTSKSSGRKAAASKSPAPSSGEPTKSTTRKPPAKKPATAKSSSAKKTATKSPAKTAKKSAAKKTTAKPAAKKPAAKKPAAKKAAPKKTPARKSPAKKKTS
ncbi:MAG: Rne/Rng family ribonuclease [Planctomycetes bacterium]|nr:Rne/Rng family ribonuclease [Planctomycetota bacterium]